MAYYLVDNYSIMTPFFLLLFLNNITSSYAKSSNPHYCPPSSCDNYIINITSPFRLNTDPKHCGYPEYELSCDNNLTVIHSKNDVKFLVRSINYGNYTIRIADSKLDKNNYCSFPNNFLLRENSFNGLSSYSYHSGEDVKLRKQIVFLKCENPPIEVNNNYIDTAPYYNGSNYYVVDGGLNVYDMAIGCETELSSCISNQVVVNGTNTSYFDIHNHLAHGFELSWLKIQFYNGKGYYCSIDYSDEMRCHRSFRSIDDILILGIFVDGLVLKKKSKMGKKSLANKSKGKRPIIDDFDSDFEAPMPKRVKPTSSKKSKLNLEESSLPEISGKKFQKPVTHSADRTEVWDCKFSPSDFYRSKCVCTSVYYVINNIKNTLSVNLLSLFRQTQFGHFLDMPEFVFHPQVVHSLLLREVLQPNPKEFWAKVAGRCIRFSAEEFYLISGLDCFGDCNKLLFSQETNQLVETCFRGVKTIDNKAIEDAFLGSRWGLDESIGLKMAVLYFIQCFLLSNTPDKEVSRFVLDVVDSGRWDEYCWGRESFELTIDSFKGRIEHGIIMKNRKAEKGGQYDGWYRALGCPWVFTVWFYECCPAMVNSFCKRVSSSIPRILNWSNTIVTKNPTLRDLKGKIFDLPLEKLKIKNMRPTDEERQQLQLDGLFLDESIDERGVVKQSFEGGSSSKKSDSADIDWMKSKLEMLSSNQSSLAEDFISLRCFVDFNFKSVMTVIKDIQEKVNAIHRRPSDEGKSSDELVTQDSDDDPDDDDDDDDAEDDDKQLPDPENIDSDSDDGGELVKVGGDADDADKAVTAVPSADVNPSEDVGGSDKNVKDVEKPKGDESRLKGDDFFDGLSQLVIDDDQVVLAGLEAVAKINVPAPNPDVVGEKSDAIHTDEETEDTVSDTPLLDKRKRAPALKSPFVDFGSADVGSTPMELMSSGSQSAGDDRDFKMVTYVKGLYALNDAFADPVSTEIEAKFDSWIGEGLLKHPRHYNCYEDGAKKFTPGFRLGVDYVEDKTWFYHLATCDMFMNDSHMNTIFYYLRKKGKYSSAVTLNFATTDCLFDDSIQALYHKFNKAKSMKTKMSHIHAAHPIAHYIRGMRIPCSKPWYEADHVLFIINLRRESHWVFGRLDVHERTLFLYNSLRTAKMNAAARNAMKAYSVLLPLFFDLLGFWKNRAQVPASVSDPTAPFRIVELSGLASQQKNDCGAYVAAFAEFFIHGKDVPADFDIEVYRTRLAALFYSYGQRKIDESIDSEDEKQSKSSKASKLKK